MKTSSDASFVDSNVLIYALDETSDHFDASQNLIALAQEGSTTLCATSQILAEVFAVITDQRRVDDPRTNGEAETIIHDYVNIPGIQVLSMPPDIVDQWLDLAVQHTINRGGIFDVQIVASMITHDIDRIYTFNERHFQKFSEIETIRPR